MVDVTISELREDMWPICVHLWDSGHKINAIKIVMRIYAVGILPAREALEENKMPTVISIAEKNND
jgi:ribosomal protein L7/L12